MAAPRNGFGEAHRVGILAPGAEEPERDRENREEWE